MGKVISSNNKIHDVDNEALFYNLRYIIYFNFWSKMIKHSQIIRRYGLRLER